MKVIKTLLVFLMCTLVFVPVNATSHMYHVVDINANLSIDFSNYKDAFRYYKNNVNSYDNLTLYLDDKVINTEYGIVEFKAKNKVIKYYSLTKSSNDYLCGEYGIDGAYLYTNDNADKVYFIVSGDRGYMDINDVVIRPIDTLKIKTSIYKTKDNLLYHLIKTQLDFEYVSNSLCIDYMPSFMKDDCEYYSYDGHYFYDDIMLMLDDYKNGEHENAINEQKYYNYFQYLPYRSLTNYTYLDLQDYFYNKLGINSRLTEYVDRDLDGANDCVNSSEIYGNVSSFFSNQDLYGANSLMMIASAINESNYGRSLGSYINNNLFTNAAYEGEEELNNRKYSCISNSIYSYAKYFISDLYSNHLRNDYAGTNFGNKISGINIEYSLDHYFGEKAASTLFKLDSILGGKDYNTYCIGIVEDKDITIYKDSNLDTKLYSISDIKQVPYIILDEYEDCYKIQVDYSFNNEYLYYFNTSVGYIDKDAFDYIINYDKIHEFEFNTIHYDFDGGNFHDYSSLTINSLDKEINKIVPNKEGYEFVEYEYDENNDIYIAKYKQIDSISLSHVLDKQKYLLPYPNLKNAYITINYVGFGSNKIPVNTDMISNYDPKCFDSQTLNVNYNGINSDIEIQIDEAYYEINEQISNAIEENDYSFIKDNLINSDYELSFEQIRSIDQALRENSRRNYVIDNTSKIKDISVSGLEMALDDRNKFHLFQDTYYVNVTDASNRSIKTVNDLIDGYDLQVLDSFNIKFKFNYQNIKLSAPIIIQFSFNDKTDYNLYSLYYVDNDANVYKCNTSLSDNFVKFIAYEQGDYILVSKKSFNKLEIDDSIEDLSYENMGVDNNRVNMEVMLFVLIVMLSLIGELLYFIINSKKEKQWKDFRKSLLKVDFVQEEKLKN